MSALEFSIVATDGGARTGEIVLPRGKIRTPAETASRTKTRPPITHAIPTWQYSDRVNILTSWILKS